MPKIDAWDFTRLRDGKVELRHLRCKILGIEPEKLLSEADINVRVAEYASELKFKST